MPPVPFPRRALIEELEPRLLFSADFATVLAGSLAPQAELRVIGADGEFANATDSQQQAQHAGLEVVFIDLRVQGCDKILADIHEQNTDGRSIEVVMIDAERDGIAQIGDFLSQHHDIDAVHIISHGTDGAVQLGSNTLNFDSLVKNATQIKNWGNALTTDADILLYGCDVAQQADGKALVDALSRLTGADVAATTDLTGSAPQGGDWVLEYHTGIIQAQVAISEYGQQNWNGVLATYTVTSTSDSGAGSLRQAIIDANTNAGTDTITFNIAGSGVQTIAVSSYLPSITGAVVIDGTTQPGYAGTPIIELNGAATAYDGTQAGLVITGGGTTVKDLVINRFAVDGIRLQGGSGNVIQGNYIGTDATGQVDLGNGYDGIFIVSGSTNNTIGGPNAADRNVIAGNNDEGIEINGGSSNLIHGNYIGLAADGVSALGNTSNGVLVTSGTLNQILQNHIATNGGTGINLAGGTEDAYLVTANDAGDADAGANNLQNYPVLTSALINGPQITLTGSLNSAASSYYHIEFFASSAADASGYGEGQRYLGFVNVATDGSGNATFNPTLTAMVATGEIVSATATKSNAGYTTFTNTSEFAQNVIASANSAPTLDASKSPTLTAQNEDSGAPVGAVGTLVSSLVDFASPADLVDNVTDANAGALLGIAVTAADSTNGSWWYSINGGTNWSALGAVSGANARLLAADANTRLQFQPNTNYNGTLPSAITFRAWDQTAGSNGALADTSTNSGTSPFSSTTDTASLVVNPVNDAPVVVDRALVFDGIDDRVVVNDAAALQMTTTLTIEAWIRREGTPTGTQMILNKEGEYEVSISASGTLQWAFANTAPGWVWTDTGITVPADQWTHIAVTYNAGLANTYVNGVLVHTFSGSGNIGDAYPALNTLTIGGRENATTQRFQGLIDEVRVWNVARSSADIATNYNQTLTGAETGLMGCWRFAEVAGNVAVDASPHGNNGLLGNGIAAEQPARLFSYTLAEDGSLNITAPGVLARASDAEGGPLTVILVSGPAHAASFTLNPDGSFSYTPSANFNGQDNFVFKANDGSLNSQLATVYLTVTPVNDAPTASNLNAPETYTEDTPLNLTGIVVSDIDSANVTVTLTLSAPAAGSLNTGTSGSVTSTYNAGTGIWTASGAIADVNTLLAGLTFTPAINYNSNFAIATSVSDGVAAPISGSKAMTGVAVNDAPVQVFTGTNFNGFYAYNDFSGSWFVHSTPVDTGNIQSEPQGAVLHLSSSEGGSSSSGVIAYFDGSLKLGDLHGGSFASTGSALAMNIYLDTGNDGQFFSFSGTQFTGLSGDSYGSVTLGANGGSFNDNTVFTKAAGIAALPSTFTLAQLKAGAVAGIDANTRVALWFGGGNAFSSDISNISVAASTASSLAVQEDSGLTSLGLGGVAFGPGGGADEAGQFLSYMVTSVPSAALGNVVLADGTTVVTASTSYSLAQIQGMQLQTTANANGGGATFSFKVQDSGSTLNGGVDTITQSLTLNVTPVNDAPVNTLPGAQSTSVNTPIMLSSGNGNAITVSDADAASWPVRVTLGVTDYQQGFDGNNVGWNMFAVEGGSFVAQNDASIVGSGTNGITARSGSAYAVAAQNLGAGGSAFTPFAATRAAGYSNVFPPGGFTTSIDVYLDPSGGYANDTQFDYSAAINDVTIGGNGLPLARRDFVFNTGFYNDVDATGSVDRFVISASNNAGHTADGPRTGAAPLAITTAGWYTLEHRFYDSGGGVLAVDLVVKDSAGTVLDSWTRSDPTDIIGSTVGGGRYGWFANQEFSSLAFDNVSKTSATRGTLTLAGTSNLSFSQGDGTNDSRMTFTGMPADVNTALNGLVFQPATNYSGAASLLVVSNDMGNTGTGGPMVAFGAVPLVVNAPPVGTTTGAPLAYTENAAAAAIDTSLTVSDADSVNLTGATVAISANYASGQDVLAFANQNGITASWDAGTGTLTLSGTTTVANYQAALQSVTYVNSSDAPNTLARTVSFTVVDDSSNSSAAATTTVTVAAVNDAPTMAAWYDSNWAYREQITIDHSMVSGGTNLTDFPVLINLGSDANLAAGALASGNDILFTSADGTTKLSHEIDMFTSASGALMAWVKLPTLSASVDTTLYMYFGNAAASSQQNAAGVWDASTGAVYHLGQSTDPYLDSTGNANTGAGGNSPSATSGEIGGGQSFDGATTAIAVPDNPASLDPGLNATVSAWVRVNATGQADVIEKGGPGGYALWLNDNVMWFGVQHTPDWATGTTPLSTGVWYLITGVSDNGTKSLYINGVLDATNATPAPFGNPGALQIGNGEDGHFNGVIDEVRIENTARSADWIATEFNNQDAPGSFFSVGALQSTNEDTTSSATSVNTILNWNLWADVDTGAASGIAVTSMTGNGTWEYSADGLVWTGFGAVSSSNALLLDDAAQVRYQPDSINGETATFGFKAWDQTSGSASTNATPAYADPGAGGGSGAYSVQSAVQSITVIQVNDAPAGTNKTVTTNEDTAYTFTAADFGCTDPIDGASAAGANALLAVKITALPVAGSLTNNGVAVIAGQFVSLADITAGLLKFIPAANANGAGYASFTFQVQDNGGTSNGGIDLDQTPKTMTVTVNPVTDLNAKDDSFTVNEDTTLNDSVATNDSTISGGMLSYALNTAAANGTVLVNADGTFTYTGNANFNGLDSFTYTVTDAASGESDTRTVSLTIDPVVDLTAQDDSFSVNEGTLLNGDVSLNDSTTSGGVLSCALNTAAANGMVLVNADGSFAYTGNANFHGSDSFTYTVTDAASGESDTRTVSLTINPVNDAPAGTNKTVTTNEGTAYTFTTADFGFTDPNDSPANALANVKIATLPTAGTLTNNGVAAIAGQFISLADIAGGLLKFTPAANANGAGYASFTFQVQDNGGTANGGVDLDPTPKTMTIDVTPVNDAPNATNLSAPETYTEDTPLNLTGIVVSDVDSANVTVTLTLSAPAAGTLNTGTSGAVTSTYNAGSGIWTASGALANVNTLLAGLTFTPAANFNSNFTIATSVSDGIAAPVTGNKTMTGIAVNDLNAQDDSFSVNEDTLLNGDVSLNDSTTSGGVLTYALNTAAASGVAVVNADGSFSYTGNANFNGSDSFTYTVTDAASGESDTRTVTLTIVPVVDLTAQNDSFAVNEDALLNGNVSLNDSTTSGGALSFALASAAANGTAVVNADGTSTYTGNANFNGTDSFTYTVTDAASGESSVQTVSLTVNPVTDLTAQDDAFTVNEDTTLNDSVASNDSTTSGGVLSYALAAAASNGVAVVNGDGTFSYTGDANFNGSDFFTYTVTDAASGESDVRTVSLTIDPVVNPVAIDPGPEPQPVIPPVDEPAPPDEITETTAPEPAPNLQPIAEPGFLGDNTRADSVETALNTGLKTSAPLLVNNEHTTREILSNPETHGDMLLRLLEIIQVDQTMGDSGHNRVSPAIHVEIAQDDNFNVEVILKGAQITAVSLSVGAVWWALRAGGLFTSLLTSLPAWRSFDVLPVLSREAEDDDTSWEFGDEQDHKDLNDGQHPNE